MSQEIQVISEVSYHRQDLSGRSFLHVMFKQCDFREAILTGCHFELCSFDDCQFGQTLLPGARIHQCAALGTSFHHCNFQSAQITESNFAAADLSWSNLRDISIRTCNLENVIFDETVVIGATISGNKVDGCSWKRLVRTDETAHETHTLRAGNGHETFGSG